MRLSAIGYEYGSNTLVPLQLSNENIQIETLGESLSYVVKTGI